jgi:hypothetical protein
MRANEKTENSFVLRDVVGAFFLSDLKIFFESFYIVNLLFFLFLFLFFFFFFFFSSLFPECFALLFFLMPRIMWSSRWSSSLSSSLKSDGAYIDCGLRCNGAEVGGPGKYFDLTNVEGEPLPIAWIGLSNPFVGVDVLMF